MSRDQINNIFNNEIVPSKKLPRPVTAKVQVKVTENSGNDQIPDFFFFCFNLPSSEGQKSWMEWPHPLC